MPIVDDFPTLFTFPDVGSQWNEANHLINSDVPPEMTRWTGIRTILTTDLLGINLQSGFQLGYFS